LAIFKDFKSLRVLRVSSTKISDAGLDQVKDCKNLKQLDVRNTKVTAAGIEKLAKALPQCKIEGDGGVIEPKAALAPLSDAELKRIAALPAAEQVEEVRKELKQRNPGFDGALDPKIENGVVTGLTLHADHVSDIAPVRALAGLQFLDCGGSDIDRGQLSAGALLPLKGLPLTTLRCKDSPALSDLSSLKDMKLTNLEGRHTNIGDADLANLAAMTDLQRLNLWSTKVTDAGLKQLAGLKNLQHLSLQNTKVTDAGLKQLAGLHRLETLDLYAVTKVTDAGLEHLAGLKALKRLDIRGTGVTQEGAEKLASLRPSLRIELHGRVIEPRASLDPDRKAAEYVLSIGGTVRVDGKDEPVKAAADLPAEAFQLTSVGLVGTNRVTDAGLAVFKECTNLRQIDLAGAAEVTDAGVSCLKNCTKLNYLNLTYTKVTDAGLAHFKDSKEMDFLVLDFTAVTDAGLAHFKGLKSLTWLQLSGMPKITDAVLGAFKECKNLKRLHLRESPISDAGLAHLVGMDQLTYLQLNKTQVTKTGVEGLAKALPQCKIEWDGGVIEPKK